MSNVVSLNGRAVDWVLVISNGKDFIGQPHYADTEIAYLSPVFEWQARIERVQATDPMGRPLAGPNGQPMIQDRVAYSAVPVCLLASFDRVPVMPGAIIKPLSELSTHDRDRMLEAAKQAADIAKVMRSVDSNLTLASSIPPGLKPPGLP